MEREGLIRCLNFLISKGLNITELVTDSSTSVAKTLGKHVTCHVHCDHCELLIVEKDYIIHVMCGIKPRSRKKH